MDNILFFIFKGIKKLILIFVKLVSEKLLFFSLFLPMQNINKDELLITQLFDAQPDSVLWMKPLFASDKNKESKIIDFEIYYYNKAAAMLMGINQQAALNKYLIKDNVLGGESEKLAFEQNLEVFLNNTSGAFTYFNPVFQKHFNVTGTRVNDGILNIARDITNQVVAERKMHQQSDFLNRILDASINAVLVCKAIRNENGKIEDLQMVKINQAFTDIIGKTAAEVEGKTYLSVFPSAMDLGLFELHCQVIETGEPLRKEVYYKGENLNAWYDVSLVKLGENTLVVTFSDITHRKISLFHIHRQKALLDNILKYSPSGIAVIELIRDSNKKVVDAFAIIANNAATEITGIPQEFITNKISEVDPKILANPVFHMAISILETGKPFLTQYFLKSSGKWLELGISKIDDEHLVTVFTDITSSKSAHIEVERSANQLLLFMNTAHSGLSHLIPIKDKYGEVVDFSFGITNAAFAAYAGQNPETVKGKLVSRYYPTYKENGLFDRYKYAYNSGETIRFESYYKGDGIDAWFDIMCKKVENGVLVTLTDLTTVKKLQIDLETLVNELKKSNANLEQFAYVASHDLQEPLRKIQVFTERLKKDVGDDLSEENKRVFERMIAATQRMSQLINDLLSYSQLTIKPSAFKIINLKDTVQQVLSDLEATVTEKNATISVGELPEVKGDPVQLRQLFQNLLSNSLKYSKEEVSPVVSIKATIVQKERDDLANPYHMIEIRDNGIGFEQEHVERIFKVFQRLHGRSEYPGTGIGLAIVQKVVENHNGYITAESEPEKGATFRVYLPV